MTALLGALLGLLAAAGVLITVRAAPPMRPIRLADRMAPYLPEAPSPSRLLGAPSTAPFGVIGRLLGPLLGEVGGVLDRLLGGAPSVRRRIAGLGLDTTVEQFRVEQLIWGACGLLAGASAPLAFGTLSGNVRPLFVLGLAATGLITGVLARDWWLSHLLTRRERVMLAEFPVVADLLALSVVAGEAPVDALRRVCTLTRGQLASELETALARAGAGTPLASALSELAERTSLEAFARFVLGIVVAIERGTPLADVVRAQAEDVREIGKRALLEAGGRKEVQMLVPVVFLILPVTVLFALFPGLLTLTSLAQ